MCVVPVYVSICIYSTKGPRKAVAEALRVLHSSFLLPRSLFLSPCCVFCIPHSLLLRSLFLIPHFSFLLPCSSCPVPDSSFFISCSAFPLPQSSFLIPCFSFFVYLSFFVARSFFSDPGPRCKISLKVAGKADGSGGNRSTISLLLSGT